MKGMEIMGMKKIEEGEGDGGEAGGTEKWLKVDEESTVSEEPHSTNVQNRKNTEKIAI